MIQVGMLLVALAIVALVWGFMQKLKAGRVADAPLVKTGDAASKGTAVAGAKGAISAEGAVACQQPLVSPVTGTPCLFYEIKCTAEWKDGDTTKTKEIDHQKVAATFAIDDGSGPVWIDAREGGDFEPTQTKEETKGTGLIGGITGADIAFGQYRVSPGVLSIGTKYTVKEQVLPLQPKIYACGKAAEGGGSITAPSWRMLILSNKSRDELLASATIGAKRFLLGGAAAFVVGGALALVGQLTAGPDEAQAATSPAATAPAIPETAAPAEDTAGEAAEAKAPAQTRPASAKAPARGTGGAKAPAATAGATAAPASTGASPAATGAPAATGKAPATSKPAAPPPAKK